MSLSRPFCPSSFACKYLLFNELLLRFWYTTILAPQQNPSQSFLLCPESWRSYGYGTVGPVSSWSPPFHRWGRCWGLTAQRPGCVPGQKLSWPVWAAGNTLLGQGTQPALPRPWREMGPTFPRRYSSPLRCRVSSPRANGRGVELAQHAPRLQHAWLTTGSPVFTRIVDVNTDLSCSRTTDPWSSAAAQVSPCSWLTVQATQIFIFNIIF